MNLTLILTLIGTLQVTSYQSTRSQTDSSPYYVSAFNWTGHQRVSGDGVAVSQDLLCGACRKLHKPCKEPSYNKKLHYGQWVYIQDVGFRQVNDVMHKRFKNRMDAWVPSLAAERAFHKKFGHRKLVVYKIKNTGVLNGY